jgi:hypothetical protein
MGRLNKKYFTDITIASFRLSTGEEKTDPSARIISQRATKRYKISIGNTVEVLTLVPKEAGTLLPSEFRVETDRGNVSKITNRALTVGGKKTSY